MHSELIAVLERNGVELFDPAGEQFDPALHEALSTRSEEGAGPASSRRGREGLPLNGDGPASGPRGGVG